ncbi:MAG: aminoacyl-tRNA hydrolase [Alphaproteobacteria bacterium 33-17]|nr:MAG: aminoacyl-tRNA hydrolase [Alphaproteobacteria bacterium 33-17]
MKIICGLGNPGPEYLLTRHNAGFIFVDLLLDFISRQTSANLSYTSKWQGEYAKFSYKSQDIILHKPMTYMNLSGNSLLQVKNFFKVDNKNIIVVHDDVDLAMGSVKFKLGGGHGGHNGLKSVDSMIGNNYKRLRIGVGKQGNTADYVLSKFKSDELDTLESAYRHIIDCLDLLLDDDINKFSNKIALLLK